MSDNLKFPLPGSVMHPFVFGIKEAQQRTLSLFRKMNKWIMVPLLRANILQLFGIGFIFVLLETKGRKSGLRRFTPLEYRKDDEWIYLFSSRGKRSNWYRNMRTSPDSVRIKIHFRWKKLSPVFVDDYAEKMEIMRIYTQKYPRSAKGLFGFDKKKHQFSEEAFKPLVDFIEIVKFRRH